MQFVIKVVTSWLMSALAKELAADVAVITLRRLAKRTDTTLDDEIVEKVAEKLNVK